MNQRASIREKAFANLAGLPSVLRDIQRHVDHHWGADDVAARNAAPEAAVVRIAAVIAHREITIFWNMIWKFQVSVAGRRSSRRGWIGAPDGVILLELLTIDPHCSFANVERIAGKANGSVDYV